MPQSGVVVLCTLIRMHMRDSALSRIFFFSGTPGAHPVCHPAGCCTPRPCRWHWEAGGGLCLTAHKAVRTTAALQVCCETPQPSRWRIKTCPPPPRAFGLAGSEVHARTTRAARVPHRFDRTSGPAGQRIVRKTTSRTGAWAGVLFADQLDGSRFCSPFHSRTGD